MKKVIMLMAMPLLFACSAEDSTDCNCGLIVRDNVKDYSVTIRNACSGNEQTFRLQQGDWINAHVGSDYCITNVTNWKLVDTKKK
jgi:hypothetical protein